jgi:hypothetical protein
VLTFAREYLVGVPPSRRNLDMLPRTRISDRIQ